MTTSAGFGSTFGLKSYLKFVVAVFAGPDARMGFFLELSFAPPLLGGLSALGPELVLPKLPIKGSPEPLA